MNRHERCLTTEMKKDEITDQNLLLAVKAGDMSAFTELVQRHEERVAATVYGMLGQCPEAEDVGQETFIRFYKSIHKFRGDSSLATYLTRIAINLSLNELKRRKRRQHRSVQLENARHVVAETDSEDPELKQQLQRAIETLAPDHRSVVVLRLVDGLSTKETAAVLNVPEGTVLSRLARAVEKLRNSLGPMLGDRYE